MAADADQAVGRLAFLTANEQAIVERLRNPASVDHRGVLAQAGGANGPALLHRLVDHWATAAPANPALVSPARTLSFAALARSTDALAAVLREEGVRPGMVVGVEAAHSVDAVLGIIATIKAGAICLPVDTRLPPERLNAMIADSGCRHVLASAGAPLGRFDGKRLALDGAARHAGDAPAPAAEATPDHGVFLTYTSGTTGAPKASVLHHRGIVNYIGTVIERFGYTCGDRAMLFAPLTFDASLEEIFAPLCAGASLYIGDENVKRSVPALVDACRAQRISVLTLPTAYWRVLGEHLAANGGAAGLGAVRLVSIGGEKVTLEAIRQWHRATAGRIALYNIYGPSECSIGSIVDRIDVARALEDGEVYLHRPVANAHLHVLDACLNPVPADMPGELYIGGVGVAHGYHGRPALTAQRFVADPFAAAPARACIGPAIGCATTSRGASIISAAPTSR